MKINTLCVFALGVGIVVDYGIYLFARMREAMLRADGDDRISSAQDPRHRHLLHRADAGSRCGDVDLLGAQVPG